jgi:UDP-N-acetylmuramate--alanine ligase
MLKRVRRLHFVGIGGIGMSGIAELLINLDYEVSGSDLRSSPITERLEGLGGTVFIGHAADNTRNADVVITSSAVDNDNPEVTAARASGIPVIPRAEMLAELMRMRHGILIAGSHGKTTTTSMMATVFEAADLDPTVVIGGRLEAWGTNARLGQGEFMVAEADESDGSFLRLSPTIAVVTNIDLEHLDHYDDFDALRDAFVEFLNKVPFYGTAVVCLDDPELQEVMPRVTRKLLTYGLNPQSDIRASAVEVSAEGTRLTCHAGVDELGEIRLRVLGRHNALNALACVAVGLDLGIAFTTIADALASYAGTVRRFERIHSGRDILVVDDYGHHPTEIRAVLGAAGEAFPDRRKVVCFQPHRYSRSHLLRDDFGRAFYNADVVLVLPIYAAGEEPIPGVTGEDLALAMKQHGQRQVTNADDLEAAFEMLTRCAQPGDIVLTLGAGDVWKLAQRVGEWLSGVERSVADDVGDSVDQPSPDEG